MSSLSTVRPFVPNLFSFFGPDGTTVDIFKTLKISENQDLEDCHYVVTVAVVAASLLAGLAAAPKSMQG